MKTALPILIGAPFFWLDHTNVVIEREKGAKEGVSYEQAILLPRNKQARWLVALRKFRQIGTLIRQ